MKAIILSAGQGRRLLPLTAERPKCLLPVRGDETLLDLQLQTLAAGGVRHATVVVGHGAEHVTARLRQRALPGLSVRSLYNPLFDSADNLVSCWLARGRMREPFVLLNGDTVFEIGVLERLLAAPPAPLTLAVDHKPTYDADDMKVRLDGTRLVAVGKDLPPQRVDGESIGVMVFRGDGPRLFRRALRRAVREPDARHRWYLSVVDALARTGHVRTTSIHGLRWWEIDRPEDLIEVRAALAGPHGGDLGRRMGTLAA